MTYLGVEQHSIPIEVKNSYRIKLNMEVKDKKEEMAKTQKIRRIPINYEKEATL